MLWRIYSIDHLWSSKREDILPVGKFTLYYKQTKKSVTGWLPSHHPDVLYSLEFDANKIKKILHIETTKKKGRPILKRYTKNLPASKKNRTCPSLNIRANPWHFGHSALCILYSICHSILKRLS